MHIVEICCEALMDRKIVTSQAKFARLIGRGVGYITDLKRERPPSLSIMVRLWFQLAGLHQFDLAAQVYDAMQREALSAVPQKRTRKAHHGQQRWPRERAGEVERGVK
jgi:hypothetical protein